MAWTPLPGSRYIDGLCATKSEGVGVIVRAINFQEIYNLRGPDPRTSQTDGRTHARTTC